MLSLKEIEEELKSVGIPVHDCIVDGRFEYYISNTKTPISLRSLQHDNWVYYFRDCNEMITFMMEHS